MVREAPPPLLADPLVWFDGKLARVRAGRRLLRAVSLAGCATIGDEAATVLAGKLAAACRHVFTETSDFSSRRPSLRRKPLTLGATHVRNAGLPHLEVISLSRTAVTDAMVNALTFGVRRSHLRAHVPADPELEGWIPLERLAEIELRGAWDEFALPSHTLCMREKHWRVLPSAFREKNSPGSDQQIA